MRLPCRPPRDRREPGRRPTPGFSTVLAARESTGRAIVGSAGGDTIYFSFRYGSGSLSLELPSGGRLRLLEPERPSSLDEPAKLVRRALDQPVASPPLRELARGRRSAAILVPGRTRIAGVSDYVPELIDELRRAGVPDTGITVHLATGTHEHHGESDLAELLGEDVVAQVRCRAHACHEAQGLTRLGSTQRGTDVAIATGVLEAEIKILTGRIVPHYFAGFSGGRKALVPGVAGFETIQANHRLTLAPERGIHPEVAPCSLAANPVHLDMLEAAAMAAPDFCLNTLFDTRGRMVGAVAGHWERAHEVGCREAGRRFGLRVEEPVDLLVTSAGGLPHDCNFMQSIKAVLNLQRILRPGGRILWIAQAAGGMHPGFLEWAAIEDDAELERAVRANYSLTGHNSIMLRRLLRNARVMLKSDLPPDLVARLGFGVADSPQAALDELCADLPPDLRVAVAPCANAISAGPGGAT
jgi:nickel-dependent lactate racemase